jgi:hypothetical protein
MGFFAIGGIRHEPLGSVRDPFDMRRLHLLPPIGPIGDRRHRHHDPRRSGARATDKPGTGPRPAPTQGRGPVPKLGAYASADRLRFFRWAFSSEGEFANRHFAITI